MEMKQLKYFVAIVENNYNLSKAAGSIHISQSALSQMVKNFEEVEGALLFERHHGRLMCLSAAGEVLYNNAKVMIEIYDSMLQEIRNLKHDISGEITIGIPHLIISTVFSEAINYFNRHHPNIKMNMVVMGAYTLQKKLIANEIDIAITLKPTLFDSKNYEELMLIENQLCAFVDINHKFASRRSLDWQDFEKEPFAILDKGHMINQLLVDEFAKHSVNPNILIRSSYWDFLLRSTLKTDIITILPAVLLDYFPSNLLKAIPINSPVKWQVVMCCHKKKRNARVLDFVFTSIHKHFKNFS